MRAIVYTHLLLRFYHIETLNSIHIIVKIHAILLCNLTNENRVNYLFLFQKCSLLTNVCNNFQSLTY